MAFDNYLKVAVLSLAGWMPLLASAADEGYQRVTVVQTDGESYSLDLVDMMHALFDEAADFVVRVPALDADGHYAYDEATNQLIEETVLRIPGLTLQEALFPAATGGVEGVSAGCRLSYDPMLAVLYVEGEGELSIFNTSGVNVYGRHLDGEYRAEIPMRRYGAGVYVVKIDSKTLKLYVR